MSTYTRRPPSRPRRPGGNEPNAAQLGLYNRMAAERGLPTLTGWQPGLTKGQASRAIDALKAHPVQRPAGEAFSNVPDGRYALRRTPDMRGLGDDTVVFFRVNTGAKGGKYEGFRFLDRVIGGDHRDPIKGQQKSYIMNLIAADLKGAAILFGQEMGKCSFCHHDLSDDDSRILGIGPDCFEKHFGRRRTAADVAAAREAREFQGSPKAAAAIPAPAPVETDIGNVNEAANANRELLDSYRHDAAAQAMATSARRRDAMIARIESALDKGTDPEFIKDAVLGDELLADAHKDAILAQLEYAVSERRNHALMQASEQDDTIAAAIAKAYAEGDATLGRRLEAEAGPEYAARREARFGF